MSGVKLERSYSTKYLGLILDKDLTWKPHLYYMQKKLAQGVGLMAKMRKHLSNKNFLSLYYAFFYSNVFYGILGWGSATKSAIMPIQVLQNKAIRIITNVLKSSRTNSGKNSIQFYGVQLWNRIPLAQKRIRKNFRV